MSDVFISEPAEQACEKAAAAEPHEEGSVADAASAVAAVSTHTPQDAQAFNTRSLSERTCVTSPQVSVSTCEETPQTVSITPQQSAPGRTSLLLFPVYLSQRCGTRKCKL